MPTTEVNVWKTRFWKNGAEKTGAQEDAIKALTQDQVPIKSWTIKNGQMWGITTPDKLLKLIEKNNGIYELLHSYPKKVYFDIDKSENFTDNYLDVIKNHIESLFPEGDMAISGSKTAEKESYHITLNNYLIHSKEDLESMKLIAKYMNAKLDDGFDWKVYTKNRVMKSINQSKTDGRVQEIIENPDFKKHLITCFFNPFVKPLPTMPEAVEDEIQVAKTQGTFNLASLPKMVLSTPSEVDFDRIEPMEILKMLPLNKSFEHSYTHLVARFCYYNNITFDEFIAWLANKHSGSDVSNKWAIHWNKIGSVPFPPVSSERIKQLLSYFYPSINKDKAYRDFVDTFNLPTEMITPIETMNQECFLSKNKYGVFAIGMGGGKTAQTIDYLKTQSSFLWIAPNKALANNTHKRLKDVDIECKHYLELSTKNKKLGQMNAEYKLISVLNSLHYLNETTTYDVIIIDEIETVLDKFLGDFMEQGKLKLKSKIWQIFCKLIVNAEKVILLDAFITTKTIDFIKNLQPKGKAKIDIFKRINEPQTRTIVYQNNFEMALHDAIKKIKSGCKVFIFYPYKKDYDGIFSMERIYKTIEKETGAAGIFYNADVDDKIKAGLKDVNTSWGNKKFVITNNIITCGVNYESLDFDYKYLFIAPHNTPRDIIQVSYRARYLSTGIINVCYMGKMNQVNTWLDDCKEINCPIYTALYKHILIEKKAPIKRSFQLFCVKAHYKQIVDTQKISEIIEKQITDLLLNHQLGMNYISIENIQQIEAERLQQLCMAQEATMLDKMILQKYFYKKRFTDEGQNDEIIGDAWDANYVFFFEQLKSVFLNSNNIFNKIMEFNKLTTIFPSDLKKIKLNPEILEQIFNEFSFKFITKTSGTCKILKEIYNVYFGKQIIKIQYYTGSNDIKYYIDESEFQYGANDYYQFGKQHLILDNTIGITYNNICADKNETCIEV
jgi:uncharacterized protein YaiE (UPF0345 family)